MSDGVATVIASCIASSVTILGFIVTFILTQKKFKDEIRKNRFNTNLEKIADLPTEIQELIDDVIESRYDLKYQNLFDKVEKTIFAYGSKNSISVMVDIKETDHKNKLYPEQTNANEIIALFFLLLCQIRYDLTGVEMNPKKLYKMRLKDSFLKDQESLYTTTNEVVDRLGLPSFLKIS